MAGWPVDQQIKLATLCPLVLTGQIHGKLGFPRPHLETGQFSLASGAGSLDGESASQDPAKWCTHEATSSSLGVMRRVRGSIPRRSTHGRSAHGGLTSQGSGPDDWRMRRTLSSTSTTHNLIAWLPRDAIQHMLSCRQPGSSPRGGWGGTVERHLTCRPIYTRLTAYTGKGDSVDWWFKLAMLILVPIALIELVALFVPLPRRKKKWGSREY